jgi:predicted DNA-binding transcriptional regulator AlpA
MTTQTNQDPAVLPLTGMSRFSQFKQFLPFSKEKFRQFVKVGKAPKPIRLSSRMTAYSNEELHRFLADPLNYEGTK